MHLAANASILHRVSGVIMVFAIGILLLTFQPLFLLLKDLPLFKIVLMAFFFKFIIFGCLSALTFHILAGVRHLFMDLGHFEELVSGNMSAKFIMMIWLAVSAVIGVWLW